MGAAAVVESGRDELGRDRLVWFDGASGSLGSLARSHQRLNHPHVLFLSPTPHTHHNHQVPTHKVKLVVGAGGEKIGFIQKKSKCRVQVCGRMDAGGWVLGCGWWM